MKLSGHDYTGFWLHRVAAEGERAVGRRGMTIANVIEQGDLFWNALRTFIPEKPAARVAEFGCGWGRMLAKLAEHCHASEAVGVDFVQRSLILGRHRFPTLKLYQTSTIPAGALGFDVVMTCTALQHVTDPKVFPVVMRSIIDACRPGGTIVMLENMQPSEASHMAGRPAADYLAMFPSHFDTSLHHATLAGERLEIIVARSSQTWPEFFAAHADHVMWDIDGVICEQYPPHLAEESEELPETHGYWRQMAEVAPLHIPGRPALALCTGRREITRIATEAWLRKHDVRYSQLLMYPRTLADRRREPPGAFKADEFAKQPAAQLFFESDLDQAETIHQASGKPVFCSATMAFVEE